LYKTALLGKFNFNLFRDIAGLPDIPEILVKSWM
jgi:hypothetical protein